MNRQATHYDFCLLSHLKNQILNATGDRALIEHHLVNCLFTIIMKGTVYSLLSRETLSSSL